MRAKILGLLSALTASLCCIGPLLLVALGLGGLGLGAIIGKYHWVLILMATLFLVFSWKSYFREKKVCQSKQCEFQGKRLTRISLILASAFVLVFAGLNFYIYAKGSPKQPFAKEGLQSIIPVKGMTCFTCEIAVQSAVKKLPGIYSVKASVMDQKAYVAYDSEKVNLEQIIEAINSTGFKAGPD